MIGRHQRIGRVALWATSALTAAAVTHLWNTHERLEAYSRPYTASEAAPGSGRAITISSTAVGPTLPPDIDLSELGLADSAIVLFSLQAPIELAHRDPPPEVRTCREYLEWAQHQGAVPIGPDPLHALIITASRHVTVDVSEIAAVQTAASPQWPSTTTVELTCDSGESDSTADDGATSPEDAEPDPPQAELYPPGSDLPPYRGPDHGPIPGTQHVLGAGQTLTLKFAIASPPGSQLFEYDIKVRITVDGKPETHTVTNGPRHFRCCGRTTHMGYRAATYTWTMAPQRAVQIFPSQTYTDDAPPRECDPPQKR